jgi:hypothetical protein
MSEGVICPTCRRYAVPLSMNPDACQCAKEAFLDDMINPAAKEETPVEEPPKLSRTVQKRIKRLKRIARRPAGGHATPRTRRALAKTSRKRNR